MSAYRENLPDAETRARYDTAVMTAGQILARACRERHLLAEIEAAADQAYEQRPGKPLTPEIAAKVARLLPAHSRRGSSSREETSWR